MPTCLVDPTTIAKPLYTTTEENFAAWLKDQSPAIQAWVSDLNFKGRGGQTLVFPNQNGTLGGAIYVIGGDDGAGGPWAWASLWTGLPDQSVFHIANPLNEADVNDAPLGFALASYSYDRYRTADADAQTKPKGPFLVWPEGTDQAYVREAFGATKLARDLINTPASDLGPAELARAAQDLAKVSGATYSDIVGVDLIRKGFPAIYAVGRGAEDGRAPRLIDFTWGAEDAPKITLVGKGVCFDSGGLDIKSASGMRLMKKDMGGAALVLALASMVMAAKLDVRLRVLIAAVENSVSDMAMRPLDVIATRKGLTVEIGHTDAEGRVVLADALARACEEKPDFIFDFATLTGAARVALGTEIPALFCNDNELANDLLNASQRTADPLWRMPLYQPYNKKTKGKVADLRNDTDNSYGGAIMAGLFLNAFIEDHQRWAHIDLMAWNPQTRPGRPEGGEAMGLRAVFAVLQERFAH